MGTILSLPLSLTLSLFMSFSFTLSPTPAVSLHSSVDSNHTHNLDKLSITSTCKPEEKKIQPFYIPLSILLSTHPSIYYHPSICPLYLYPSSHPSSPHPFLCLSAYLYLGLLYDTFVFPFQTLSFLRSKTLSPLTTHLFILKPNSYAEGKGSGPPCAQPPLFSARRAFKWLLTRWERCW